jgi:hypothetical protein
LDGAADLRRRSATTRPIQLPFPFLLDIVEMLEMLETLGMLDMPWSSARRAAVSPHK